MIVPQKTEVIAGDTVVFTCVAFGDPLPSITWSSHSDNVVMNSSRMTVYGGVTFVVDGLIFVRSFLEVCSVEEDDAGNYSCYSDNTFSDDIGSFAVFVEGLCYQCYGLRNFQNICYF